jgi:hypothetical protein
MERKRAKNISIYLYFVEGGKGLPGINDAGMMEWPTSGRRRLWALCSVRRQISIDTSLSFTQYIWAEIKTYTRHTGAELKSKAK